MEKQLMFGWVSCPNCSTMNPMTVSWRFANHKHARCLCCNKPFWFTKEDFREEKVRALSVRNRKIRDELVALLKVPIHPRIGADPAEVVADYLLDNDVTIQHWIPIEERLPTIHDADEDNCVLAIHKMANKKYYHWRTVVDNPFDFTHWMHVPMGPKKEG